MNSPYTDIEIFQDFYRLTICLYFISLSNLTKLNNIIFEWLKSVHFTYYLFYTEAIDKKQYDIDYRLWTMFVWKTKKKKVTSKEKSFERD